MADDVSNGPSPGPGDEGASAVGVRFRDSGRIQFFESGVDSLEVGTWVACTTSRGQEAGRVVIAPHQVLMSQLDGELKPIDRVLSREDVDRMEELREVLTRELGVSVQMRHVGPRDEALLIGGLGTCGRHRSGMSYENELYRRAKQELPRLGQRIRTPEGEGLVVSLDVFKELVTVRLTDPSREQMFPAAALMDV
jgi:cell fate regulator YaaT (PSP1 superfamily)